MTTVRTFVAIELSPEAQTALADVQSRLKAVTPPNTVRWTAPQNIHLTLHFLGDVASDDITIAADEIVTVAANYPPFRLGLGRLGCFPNTRRPRVIWVGVLGDTSTLINLHQHVGDRLRTAINFASEKRPYSPHLTIARVKKGISSRHMSQLSQVLEHEQPQVGHLADLNVTTVSLMKSELKPTGAVYTQLSKGELNPGVAE